MSRIWRNYNLSIVLAALFLVSWTVQTWAGWMQYTDEQRSHGQAVEVAGYVWHWAEATFENWQSEFLQLLTFVVLTSFLIHKGSHESKDSDDEMMARLNRIERKLEQLTAGSERRADVASPKDAKGRR